MQYWRHVYYCYHGHHRMHDFQSIVLRGQHHRTQQPCVGPFALARPLHLQSVCWRPNGHGLHPNLLLICWHTVLLSIQTVADSSL